MANKLIIRTKYRYQHKGSLWKRHTAWSN